MPLVCQISYGNSENAERKRAQKRHKRNRLLYLSHFQAQFMHAFPVPEQVKQLLHARELQGTTHVIGEKA